MGEEGQERGCECRQHQHGGHAAWGKQGEKNESAGASFTAVSFQTASHTHTHNTLLSSSCSTTLTSFAGANTHLCRAISPASGIIRQKAPIIAAPCAMCMMMLGLLSVASCLPSTACWPVRCVVEGVESDCMGYRQKGWWLCMAG